MEDGTRWCQRGGGRGGGLEARGCSWSGKVHPNGCGVSSGRCWRLCSWWVVCGTDDGGWGNDERMLLVNGTPWRGGGQGEGVKGGKPLPYQLNKARG